MSGLMGLKTDQLNGALNAARQSELLLEDMVAWMSRTEDTLAHASQHPIPNDVGIFIAYINLRHGSLK